MLSLSYEKYKSLIISLSIYHNLTDIDLKVAAKFFGSKFACGSSVTGDDEIVIQGDVKDDLFEVIPEKWPQVIIIYTYSYKIKNIFFYILSFTLRSMKIL